MDTVARKRTYVKEATIKTLIKQALKKWSQKQIKR